MRDREYGYSHHFLPYLTPILLSTPQTLGKLSVLQAMARLYHILQGVWRSVVYNPTISPSWPEESARPRRCADGLQAEWCCILLTPVERPSRVRNRKIDGAPAGQGVSGDQLRGGRWRGLGCEQDNGLFPLDVRVSSVKNPPKEVNESRRLESTLKKKKDLPEEVMDNRE